MAGVLKPFDEVTDEDTDHLMTEEEREVSDERHVVVFLLMFRRILRGWVE